MAVGSTGCGKSTLMNALIQGAENIYLNENMNILAKHKLVYKDQVVFKIGQGVISCTQLPGFYPYQDIYFVDCPGLND